MEKVTWKATLLPGMREEYIRRHDEIWPEMKQVLAEAGIVNYTIWRCGNDLFGYYECTLGKEHADKVQGERVDCQASATAVNTSKGVSQLRRFLGL